MKRKLSYSAILVAVMVIVMASVALATTNGTDLIGWLFGDNVPRGMVEQALSKPGATAEKDGLQLSIDECIYDGNTFSFSVTAESSRDETVFFGTYLPVFEPELQPSTGGRCGYVGTRCAGRRDKRQTYRKKVQHLRRVSCAS